MSDYVRTLLARILKAKEHIFINISLKTSLYDFQHSSVIMKSFFFYIAFNLNYVSEYTWATKFYTTDFFNKPMSL